MIEVYKYLNGQSPDIMSDKKIPTIWEMFIYLNLRLPEQKRLA